MLGVEKRGRHILVSFYLALLHYYTIGKFR